MKIATFTFLILSLFASIVEKFLSSNASEFTKMKIYISTVTFFIAALICNVGDDIISIIREQNERNDRKNNKEDQEDY